MPWTCKGEKSIMPDEFEDGFMKDMYVSCSWRTGFGMVVVVLTEEGEQGPSSQMEDRMRQMLARPFKSNKVSCVDYNYALDPIPSLLLSIGPGIVSSFASIFPLYWLIPNNKQTNKTPLNNFNQVVTPPFYWNSSCQSYPWPSHSQIHGQFLGLIYLIS